MLASFRVCAENDITGRHICDELLATLSGYGGGLPDL